MNYSINDFRRDFPDDDSCLEYVFRMRFGNRIKCPKCKEHDKYYRVKNRKSYVCSKCGNQIYPTANTIFHKSSTNLTLWFYAIFLMSKSKKKFSAKELERQLGVTYKCAHRIGKQIKQLMIENPMLLQGYPHEISSRCNSRNSSPCPFEIVVNPLFELRS